MILMISKFNCRTEIIHRVLLVTESRPPFRPTTVHMPVHLPDYIRRTLAACWSERPADRPDMRQLRAHLKPMQTGLRPNIFDNMLAMMEHHAYNLESLVRERTAQLSDERQRSEALLLRMLPPSVAGSLMRGERVAAESFDCVTIFFSDVVDFTELCARRTPLQVVDMLNDLYTCCDAIVSGYDVYKVETIGDAYMVVSGLPQRNGRRHAGEIARMALEMLAQVQRRRFGGSGGAGGGRGERLRMRAGVHSGQCVAGVVGVKMPRYCLFGDAVNVAARMESTGEARRVHLSERTARLLEQEAAEEPARGAAFRCVERGMVHVKGKGEMRTFWLEAVDEAESEFVNAPDILNNGEVDSSCESPPDTITFIPKK